MNNLAKNIFLLRTRNDRSQAEVCALLGFPRNTWSNWENGISAPDIDKIIAIAHYFDINVGDLISADLSIEQSPDTVNEHHTDIAYVNEDTRSYERTTRKDKKEDTTAGQESLIIALKGQIKAQESTIQALQRTVQLLEDKLRSLHK